MNRSRRFWKAGLLCALLLIPAITPAQGTVADYERAQALRNRLQALAVNMLERANWRKDQPVLVQEVGQRR